MAFLIILLIAFLPPCVTEDSTNCGWNAATQGNGTGTSFVSINGVQYNE